jgi:hypothetical protein
MKRTRIILAGAVLLLSMTAPAASQHGPGAALNCAEIAKALRDQALNGFGFAKVVTAKSESCELLVESDSISSADNLITNVITHYPNLKVSASKVENSARSWNLSMSK